MLGEKALDQAGVDAEERDRRAWGLDSMRNEYRTSLGNARRGQNSVVKWMAEFSKVERWRGKSLKSYNDRLPADILVTIGMFGLTDNPDIALIMCGVCLFWRQATINQPLLWGHIVLSSTRPADTVKLWQKRCGKGITKLFISRSFDCVHHRELLSSMRYLLAEVHHLYIDRKVNFIKLG